MVESLLMSARHPVPCAVSPLMPVSHNGLCLFTAIIPRECPFSPFVLVPRFLHGSPGEAATEWVSSSEPVFIELWAMQTSSQGMQKNGRPRPGGVTAKAGKAPSTVRPFQAWRSFLSLLCKRVGGTVSQLWQLFRTHDWFVRPLPAVFPLVSLSLSFHIRAHEIYWCLCSRTGSDPSLFLLCWSPFPRGCWRPGPARSGITLSCSMPDGTMLWGGQPNSKGPSDSSYHRLEEQQHWFLSSGPATVARHCTEYSPSFSNFLPSEVSTVISLFYRSLVATSLQSQFTTSLFCGNVSRRPFGENL
ncbi:uncharacterized protein LOC130850969 [Hippopotamus amphibius kiboko]|uniref:uncharacterized protein LOC130850969 n=1 Tax=Hippopotamus amphibius kiboko TaxID=575201 RepID=UPI00259844CF|nr:uncharacterized protein LOC130850969 [Hippopotamus amphibius kiboko]